MKNIMRYTKNVGGMDVTKRATEIIVVRNGMQIVNPSHNEIIADGWKVKEEEQKQPTLQSIKEGVIISILAYDNSSAVNEFSMGGLPIWLDKATRAGLLLRFEAEAKAGRTSTTLWYNGLPFTLPLTYAQEILIALELYASACYDNTQSHIAAVQKLDSKEAVEAYDYTTGYPQKLLF